MTSVSSGKPAPRTMVIVAVALVAAVLFMLPATSNMAGLRLVTKPIPVLCMALWLALQPVKGRFQTAVVIGLVLGAAGDLLLEIGDSTFLFGLVAFLLGHLAYIYAFLQDCRRPSWGWAALAYLYAAIAFFVLFQAGNLGAMTVPVAVYVLVITTMLWRGLSRLGAPGVVELSARWGVFGSLLFTISDSVLAYSMFVARFDLASLLIMTTYWLGQLGITLAAATQAPAAAPTTAVS